MGTCCKAAPVVIELDQNGKVVQGWGDKAKEEPANWPRNPHGIFVDHNDSRLDRHPHAPPRDEVHARGQAGA